MLSRRCLQTLIFLLDELLLHRQLVLLLFLAEHLKGLHLVLGLLGLLEAIGRWYLVIKVHLIGIEDQDATPGDDVALTVYKIATSIH